MKSTKRLSEQIIDILSYCKFLSAKEIQHKIKKTSRRVYSIQGVYKELKTLQENGVIFKVKKTYSLHLPWVLNFLSRAEVLSKNYIEDSKLNTILPSLNNKKIWHFTNLLKMNDFWAYLILTLVQKSQNKILLGWNPHPWFHLIQTEKEREYIKSLKITNSKLYLIVGDNTFLDKWSVKFWDNKTVNYSFAKSGFSSKESTYYNVIDDYVLTVKIDKKTSKQIKQIYDKTTSMNDIDLPSVIKIFSKKTKSSVWLEKNPKKARRIKNRFEKYWGVKFK